MSRIVIFFCGLTLLSAVAVASSVPIGTLNFDLTGLPGTATIDIANQTGPNSSTFPITDFPVSTSVSLSNLSLTLDFSDGTTQAFGPASGYFTLAGDGLSFDGSTISISTPVTEVILTGNLDTTSLTLNDGSSFAADGSFTATITDSAGNLADGDFGIISATPAGTSPVPEPSTWILLGSVFAVLLLLRVRGLMKLRRPFSLERIRSMALLIFCTILMTSVASAVTASVKLNSWASPSSGISGTSLVWVTGSGFPSGTIDPGSVTIDLETSCGTTAGETAATASAVKPILGSTEKIEFKIPASLSTGNYFVTLRGSTTGGTAFSSSDCSEVAVTHTSTAVGSCNPGSSMGMLVPAGGSGTTPVPPTFQMVTGRAAQAACA